jgi:mono/diheme cytochrome c family protein
MTSMHNRQFQNARLMHIKRLQHESIILTKQNYTRRCEQKEITMKTMISVIALSVALVSQAGAGDADNGKHLALDRCASCHFVTPAARKEVAASPPFTAIARKFSGDPDMLVYALLDPHPRMHITLTRREAEDIADYVNTLGK